jgi:hypothetical protein
MGHAWQPGRTRRRTPIGHGAKQSSHARAAEARAGTLSLPHRLEVLCRLPRIQVNLPGQKNRSQPSARVCDVAEVRSLLPLVADEVPAKEPFKLIPLVVLDTLAFFLGRDELVGWRRRPGRTRAEAGRWGRGRISVFS